MQGVILVAVASTDEARDIAGALLTQGATVRMSSPHNGRRMIDDDVVRIIVSDSAEGRALASAARRTARYDAGHVVADQIDESARKRFARMRLLPLVRPFEPATVAQSVTDMASACVLMDVTPADLADAARRLRKAGACNLNRLLDLVSACIASVIFDRCGNVSHTANVLGETRLYARDRITTAWRRRSEITDAIRIVARHMARWRGRARENLDLLKEELVRSAFSEKHTKSGAAEDLGVTRRFVQLTLNS